MVGCVWPGPVYFPDFNHPGSFDYWNNSLFSMYTKLNTSPMGYWIDMNENSNFIPGELAPGKICPPADNTIPTDPNVDDRNYLPFNVLGDDVSLSMKSMTLLTSHYNKSDALFIPNQNTTELFFHSVNGYGEAYITYKSLQDSTKSPLVFSLSRSSFYGTGRYAAHWSGDNLADWSFLLASVSELLPF
jgi:alpha-glucosidase